MSVTLRACECVVCAAPLLVLLAALFCVRVRVLAAASECCHCGRQGDEQQRRESDRRMLCAAGVHDGAGAPGVRARASQTNTKPDKTGRQTDRSVTPLLLVPRSIDSMSAAGLAPERTDRTPQSR